MVGVDGRQWTASGSPVNGFVWRRSEIQIAPTPSLADTGVRGVGVDGAEGGVILIWGNLTMGGGMRTVVVDEFDEGCACGTCATGGGRVGSVMCRVKGSNVAGAVR